MNGFGYEIYFDNSTALCSKQHGLLFPFSYLLYKEYLLEVFEQVFFKISTVCLVCWFLWIFSAQICERLFQR